jgi:hypothetical protein
MKNVMVGALIGIAITAAFPIATFNFHSLFWGNAMVTVSSNCEEIARRCVYLRTEQGYGINTVPSVTIHPTQREATLPSFVRSRVECEPGAEIGFEWTRDELRINVSDGDCEMRGPKGFVTPVTINNL